MFTREISSPYETRPGIKSSLSFHGQMCLHVFAEMKYHPGMNSSLSKRPCKHFIWGEILKWVCFFFHFWRMYSNMISKVNVFEPNESMNIMKHKATL